jgi:hypothetical protein
MSQDAAIQPELDTVASDLLDYKKQHFSMSTTAKAAMLGVPAQRYAEHLQTCAGVVVELGAYVFNQVVSWYSSLPGVVPVAFVLKSLYDETPTQLRVRDGTAAKPVKSTVKVLQTESSSCLLLRREGAYLMSCFRNITWLQALERNTAECIRAAVLMFATLPSAVDLFLFKVRVTTTDRYGANFRAENAIWKESNGWLKLHLPCHVHIIAGGQKSSFDVIYSTISGVVNLGLAMRPAGTVDKLRRCLSKYFSESIVLCYGDPPANDLQTVLDLYLPVGSEELAAHEFSPLAFAYLEGSAKLVDVSRRALLRYFLRGNLSGRDRVEFWLPVGDTLTREQVLQVLGVECFVLRVLRVLRVQLLIHATCLPKMAARAIQLYCS